MPHQRGPVRRASMHVVGIGCKRNRDDPAQLARTLRHAPRARLEFKGKVDARDRAAARTALKRKTSAELAGEQTDQTQAETGTLLGLEVGG